MLWYKAWLETRWRFVIGLVLALCSAVGVVLTYPQVLKLMPLVPPEMPGEIGRRIRESMLLMRHFDSYVWAQWFRQNLPQLASLFAIILGTGGVLSRRAGALFTLSLPVSRKRLMRIRAVTGMSELFVLVVAPSLLISLIAPVVHEGYGIGRAVVHALCLFVGVCVYFTLTLMLSTFFNDTWRPLLIALAIALVVSLASQIYIDSPISPLHLMSAESYFRFGEIPWIGLLVAAAMSFAMYAAANATLASRDF